MPRCVGAVADQIEALEAQAHRLAGLLELERNLGFKREAERRRERLLSRDRLLELHPALVPAGSGRSPPPARRPTPGARSRSRLLGPAAG